ncbi:MAG: ATP-binding protein [Oscillospiraceae bacterium]
MDWINKFLDELILYHADLPDGTTLISEAVRRGWQGNLWHCHLTYCLVMDENPFALACERRTPDHDSLWELAKSDLGVFQQLFRMRLDNPTLMNFRHDSPATKTASARQLMALSDALAAAESADDMMELLTAYYENHGVGSLGFGEVFRVDGAGNLLPVENCRPVALSDLVGYESQKALLLENTLTFLSGRHPNNVLLYGDAGTGKSTSIQAIASEYAPKGLRLIELYKHQFALIPHILTQIKGRNYRFILFLDDLSFEEDEVEYKHLKAVMEGGAEAAPENVLIYATSNRRHLVRETWNDRADMQHDGDIHRSDTMEEKLSLAGRFGLQIYYPNPTFEEYHTIVRELAEKQPALASYPAEQLRRLAAAWQVRRGSRSGRTAQQFINDLICHPHESEESHHADA